MSPQNTPLKIGHRGAKGYVPENTLASLKKAMDLDVDIIEFDVQVCKSGELVLIHDDTVDRTTNGTGYVKDLTLTDLKSLDAGEGETIPTLDEALDLIDHKFKTYIELGNVSTARPVHDTIQKYLKRGWKNDDFIVGSFNHPELINFIKINPDVETAAIYYGIPADLAASAKEMGASILVPCRDMITQDFIDDAHTKKLKVYVYTVNEPYDIEMIKKMGVDGIFSDFPDRL